jgi:hypothetical protein
MAGSDSGDDSAQAKVFVKADRLSDDQTARLTSSLFKMFRGCRCGNA